MKTKTDLTKYESMYDTFDKGHDRGHMEGVRDFAVKLAKKYIPNKLEVVYVAATLHDVGLSFGRRTDHEKNGYTMIKNDKNIKNSYSKEDFELILDAIREHRASTGKPKSIVAKIVSDSDRAYSSINIHLKRSYAYNSEKHPELSHNEVLDKVIEYMVGKFDENGTGTRLYFEESNKLLEDGKYIIEICKKKDYAEINRMLEN
jgi:uncharacterized protein